MNTRKAERIAKRAAEAELNAQRLVHGLSGAFLHAACIRDIFKREFEAFVEEREAGKTSVAMPIDRFEVTQANRTATCVLFFMRACRSLLKDGTI